MYLDSRAVCGRESCPKAEATRARYHARADEQMLGLLQGKIPQAPGSSLYDESATHGSKKKWAD